MSIRIIRQSMIEIRFREWVRKNSRLHYRALKLKEFAVRRLQSRLFSTAPVLSKVYIETIADCNFACSFCPSRFRANKGTIMAESLFVKIVDDLAAMGYRGSVAFHLNNEPLLDTRLAVLITKARERLCGNYFYLYTNGSLATVERVRELFAAGLNRIIIDNYDDNLRYTPTVRELLSHRGAPAGDIVIKVRPSGEFLGNRAGQGQEENGMSMALVCGRPMAEMAIAADGSIPVCCGDAVGKTILGNAAESGIESIWRGQAFAAVRASLRRGERGCCRACKHCDALDFVELKGAGGG